MKKISHIGLSIDEKRKSGIVWCLVITFLQTYTRDKHFCMAVHTVAAAAVAYPLVFDFISFTCVAVDLHFGVVR